MTGLRSQTQAGLLFNGMYCSPYQRESEDVYYGELSFRYFPSWSHRIRKEFGIRIQPTTKRRVDLALRLEDQKPGGRLQPTKIHETTPHQMSLASIDDVDSDVLSWLQAGYDQNR